ncbi:MAG: epoxyqueuosine reductase QueH [Desulfofustis sp.]|nr:epoxyqueuosine reductase QueH [Desulfofustis sp.]
MSILLHVCCGPCLVYPGKVLEGEGTDFTCYFFNPNIHPYREFKQRLNSFKELADARNYSYIIDRDYGLKMFLRKVVFNEDQRCKICYQMRLGNTIKLAAEQGYRGFSTTLLYSAHQNHDLIKKQAALASESRSVPFVYHDFRVGWQQGIDESKASNLYRQSYCGCLFSEQERYDNRLKKQLKRKRKSDVQASGAGHDQSK